MAAALAATSRLFSCLECQVKGLYKNRFCKEDAPYSIIEINGEEFKRCPVQLVTSDSMEALHMYGFYNNGFLPCAGGFLEQPNRVMEQMVIIGNQIAESQKPGKKRR
jgi:hypothetical protein